MFTGLTPLKHAVRTNGIRASQQLPLLAERLREAGFQTAAFVSGYPLKSYVSGLDRGFQTYDDTLRFADRFEETYGGKLLLLLPFFQRGLYRNSSATTDRALEWLKKNGESQFFLFIHYYDPHFPYGHKEIHGRQTLHITAEPEDLPQQKRLYAQEVEAVDAQIGRLLEFLRQKGIYDRTFLLITSDHGESLGEHNYYYDHSEYLYEQLLRVPLIIRYPAQIQPATVVRNQAPLTDIFNTILSVAQLSENPDHLISLAKSPHGEDRRFVLSHSFGEASCDKHSLRTPQWKLIRCEDTARPDYQLYDLRKDPGELTNLFKTERELVRSFDQILIHAWQGATKSDQELSPEQKEALKGLGYFQ
jgi:arylsulfatase A-like enzyme